MFDKNREVKSKNARGDKLGMAAGSHKLVLLNGCTIVREI